MPQPQSAWIPSDARGDNDWTFINFALSFDGYEFLGDEILGEFCNMVKAAYERNPKVLDVFNTTGLRALLFFEQRRAKWNDQVRVDDYTNEIVKHIRLRLGE